MNEAGAEEAAHAHARAIVTGDYGTMLHRMTPDALARAIEIGNTSWNSTAYELTPQGGDGDAYVFDITYQTDVGPLSLRERFCQIDGTWKLVDLERIV